ncbi:MAG: HYExAFE family protein [Planctomycetota bacterium]|nr:MAG: HYExAFE family protein [Planctomycetota bacterium]
MTRKHIHYEVAFEDYLRSRGVPFVPVDEARRPIFAGAKIKSFDLLVYPDGHLPWIADVKGRKFPYITDKGAKRYWENWVTKEDLDCLTEWQSVFGEEFEARFVFAYWLDGPPDRWPAVRLHSFRGDYYAFLTVTLDDYQKHARPRSPSWQTLSVSAKTFKNIARPVDVYGKEQ